MISIGKDGFPSTKIINKNGDGWLDLFTTICSDCSDMLKAGMFLYGLDSSKTCKIISILLYQHPDGKIPI